MPSTPFFDLFNAVRVNAILQALQPLDLLPQSLKFLARTAVVPAVDSEIMARFTGRVQIADIISDDAQAVVYQAGKFTFESTQIPNLKHGAALTQEMINVITALAGGAGDPDGIFSNYESRTLKALLLGVQQRMEALIIAMHLDGLSYSRLGIVMDNVTWGTPADLKITPVVPWTTAATAKPLSDIRALQQLVRTRYGYTYNRMTISSMIFDLICATTQFQTEARTFFVGPSDAIVQAVIGAAPQTALLEIFKKLMGPGLEVELYDDRYWSQDAEGVLTSARFLPTNIALFTNSGDDNNPAAYDFANGEVTEFKVAKIAGSGIIGQAPSQSRGPVAYATLANTQLNPPGVNYWSVARGFPRKHLLQSSATINVGTVADPTPAAEP